MEYGIILNSMTPLRAEASDRSEMVSQLLLGEKFICEQHLNGFYKIINYADNYSGWIDDKVITFISKEKYDELNKEPTYLINVPLAEAFDLVNKCIIRIPGGCHLPNCDNIGCFGLQDKKFQVHRDFTLHETEISRNGLTSTAFSYFNAPYMWGGKTIMGIDCSGFTQIVFSSHGIKLPRDSKDQALCGEAISYENAQTEDLVFFHNEVAKIVHVGILLDNYRIIHASGSVRIDRLDEQGIYSDEFQKHTHNLHSIRRIKS